MKKWKKVTIICICVIVGIIFLFRYVADLGMWSGTSFDTYKEKAYRGQFCDELPDDSKDFCFYCFNSGFGAYSMAAFTLDGKGYDDYIDGIPGKYSKANDEYGCTGKRVSETYIVTPLESRKKGYPVSGLPGMAFLLFLGAGYLSPNRWLMLISLSDVSVFALVVMICKGC